MSGTKKELRQELLLQRTSLTNGEAAAMSLAVAERLRSLGRWRNARVVLAYWPVRNEVDTRPLITELWQRGALVLLPRCRAGEPGRMDFGCVACADELAPGPHSILEPGPGCRIVEGADPELLPDLALVPGVGFDRRGYRIGFGGGYYDRVLGSPLLARALNVGLCYGFQVVDRVPNEEFDRPVEALCTDREWIWCA